MQPIDDLSLNWREYIANALRQGGGTVMVRFNDTVFEVIVREWELPTEKDSAAASAATPVKEPAIGTISTCKACNATIVYVRPFWQHTGLISPRHPAVPSL